MEGDRTFTTPELRGSRARSPHLIKPEIKLTTNLTCHTHNPHSITTKQVAQL